MPQTSPHISRPRLAVVCTEIGIASEVWMERQACGLRGFQPSIWGWSRADSPHIARLPEVDIPGPFPQPTGGLARLQRKLGWAGAYRLSASQRQTLVAHIQAQDPDMLLVHFGWNAIVMAQVLPHLAKPVPMVVHIHGRDASALLEEPAYRAGLIRALAQADAIVAVGQHQIDRLRALGVSRDIALIPCGAPLDLFANRPLPDQPVASPATPIRFATVGRLSHEKGMLESLAAFDTVQKSLPECALVIMGFGPLYAQLEQEIQHRGLQDKVRLTGRLSPEEIAAELARCHVYLQHSQQHNGWVEGFGVTLTEAGAVGLPLLASASGGLRDQIVAGENGQFFPPGDVEAQARLMLQLARDADSRRRMGAAARDLAARFDSAKMTAKLEQLLHNTLNRAAQTG